MKNQLKKILILLLSLLIISQLVACKKEVTPFSAQTFALDTLCQITIYDDRDDMSEIIKGTFDELYRYENLLSRTKEGSDIYLINNSLGEKVTVSDDTILLINLAKEFSIKTEGLFDISIGSISSLYNFRDGTTLPNESDILEGLKHIDYTKIEVEGNDVRILDSSMVLDLGAIAKGYIGSKLGEYVTSLGIKNAVINLGGNIVVIGDKYGSGYNIGIANPLDSDSQAIGVINGNNKTIITSGTYERYIEVNGKKYHHILDPKTGYSIDTNIVQVSVISDNKNGAICDTLATILLMMGKDEGIEFINNYAGYEAIFLDKDGNITCSNPNTEFEKWINE